jgi:hypothetical protein
MMDSLIGFLSLAALPLRRVQDETAKIDVLDARFLDRISPDLRIWGQEFESLRARQSR